MDLHPGFKKWAQRVADKYGMDIDTILSIYDSSPDYAQRRSKRQWTENFIRRYVEGKEAHNESIN